MPPATLAGGGSWLKSILPFKSLPLNGTQLLEERWDWIAAGRIDFQD